MPPKSQSKPATQLSSSLLCVPTAAGLGVISYLGFTRSHKLNLLMLISAARADQQEGRLRDPMPYGCVSFSTGLGVFWVRQVGYIWDATHLWQWTWWVCPPRWDAWSGHVAGHRASLLQAAFPLHQQVPFTSHPTTTCQSHRKLSHVHLASAKGTAAKSSDSLSLLGVLLRACRSQPEVSITCLEAFTELAVTFLSLLP